MKEIFQYSSTKLLIVFVFLSFALSSCSDRLTPFTKELYQSQNWTDKDLTRIQFYLSEDLVLFRDFVERGGSRISGGEIKVRNGRKVEEITIRARTPGVFIQRPNSDHFAVSFEDGEDARYLMFGPNPKRGGTYQLLASEWNRRSGKVTYAGEKFRTQSDAIPSLLVDVDYKNTRKVSRKTASGRRVN